MKELMFVRLRSGIDIVGYVSSNEGKITIEYPMTVYIETYFEEGRQTIALREYIPQSIVDMKEVTFDDADVLFKQNTREEFIDEFDELSEIFYETTPKLKSNKKKVDESQAGEKVVSLMEALAEKKDKSMH
jgi:hypothetical protein